MPVIEVHFCFSLLSKSSQTPYFQEVEIVSFVPKKLLLMFISIYVKDEIILILAI